MEQDWHQADIIAALRKKGTTLAAVSRSAGLSSTTLANALVRPWPKGEKIIADVIGINPEVIWPSRYSRRQRREEQKEQKEEIKRMSEAY